VFLVLAVLMISALVFFFRYIGPEQFVGPGGMDVFRGYVDLVATDRQSWNPGKWAADFITAISQGAGNEAWRHGLRLFGLSGLGWLLMVLVARRFYRPSWDRALQALSGESHIGKTHVRESRLMRLLSVPSVAQEAREIMLFLRDPSQWSQIFVLVGLLAMYLFSVTKLPLEPFGGTRYQLAIGNSGFVAFVCLSTASRFVFTSFSSDGPALWLMKSSPSGWYRWVRSKFLVFGLPTLVFTLALAVGSGLVLDLNATQITLIGLGSFWDALILLFLSVAFGMLFLDPNVENPLKLIISPGGFLLMAVGMSIMAIHVVLRLCSSSELLSYLLMRVGGPNVLGTRVLAWTILLIVAELALLVWVLRKGFRHLQHHSFV